MMAITFAVMFDIYKYVPHTAEYHTTHTAFGKTHIKTENTWRT